MQFQKITANLMVSDVAASAKFYVDVLGMAQQITVPDQPPFVFVAVGNNQVEVFLNKEDAPGKAKPGGISLYMEIKGLDEFFDRVQQNKIKIEIAMNETFYGMREFAVLDPDGYLLIFAERIAK